MLFILTVILFFFLALPAILFAPWVPTKRRDFDRVDELMDIHPGMVVMDLGCGTGGPLFDLARRHPAAIFIGVELSVPLYLICELRCRIRRSPNVSFRLGNLLTTNIILADRIYLFGTPKGFTEKLKRKFITEAKDEARIISYCFKMEGWTPEAERESGNGFLPVYRYKVPEVRVQDFQPSSRAK